MQITLTVLEIWKTVQWQHCSPYKDTYNSYLDFSMKFSKYLKNRGESSKSRKNANNYEIIGDMKMFSTQKMSLQKSYIKCLSCFFPIASKRGCQTP
jgi:hypothetical protein